MGDHRGAPPSHLRRRLTLGLLCLALLLAAGAYVGGRSPWGTKHAQVAHGVAMLAGSDNDLVTFDGEGDTELQFGGHHMSWRSGSEVGDGNPPCLRVPQRKVKVDVGVMWIARPDGGSFHQAVWVECP